MRFWPQDYCNLIVATIFLQLGQVRYKHDITHGCSKRSSWSGFGRTSFYVNFWKCACADNEIFALAQLQRAITRACTTPWLHQVAVSPIPRHKMISPKSHIIQQTIKFHKCTFGQKKAVSHAFQSAWFSKWQARASNSVKLKL